MIRPKKRDRIQIEGDGFTCVETVFESVPDTWRGPDAWKLTITTLGDYVPAGRYSMRGLSGPECAVIVESIQSIPNRDTKRVVFTNDVAFQVS